MKCASYSGSSALPWTVNKKAVSSAMANLYSVLLPVLMHTKLQVPQMLPSSLEGAIPSASRDTSLPPRRPVPPITPSILGRMQQSVQQATRPNQTEPQIKNPRSPCTLAISRTPAPKPTTMKITPKEQRTNPSHQGTLSLSVSAACVKRQC